MRVRYRIVDCALVENRLQAAIGAAGLTQERAAALMGVSYQHLNRLIKARHMPSLEMAVRASQITGWAIEKLFVFEVKRARAA